MENLILSLGCCVDAPSALQTQLVPTHCKAAVRQAGKVEEDPSYRPV